MLLINAKRINQLQNIANMVGPLLDSPLPDSPRGFDYLFSEALYGIKTNNHNEARYGTYKIHMADWNASSDRQFVTWARETLPELNRLGPTFQLVDSGENITVLRADVVDNASQCATRDALAYQVDQATGQRRIVIDPVCVNGELEFKTAFIHEIGHSLGMSHICRVGEQSNDCSPVGHGIAVMNPNILYDLNQSGDDFNTVHQEPLPTWELQSLDFKEFNRVRPLPQ